MKQLMTLILSVVVFGLLAGTATAQNLQIDTKHPFFKSDIEPGLHTAIMELMADDDQFRSAMKQHMMASMADVPLLAEAVQCVQVCSIEGDNNGGNMGEVKSDSKLKKVLAESDYFGVMKLKEKCPMMGDDQEESDDHDDHH